MERQLCHVCGAPSGTSIVLFITPLYPKVCTMVKTDSVFKSDLLKQPSMDLRKMAKI